VPDDKFRFVFTHLDALEAVAEQGRRVNLAAAFGYSGHYIRAGGWSTEAMISLGWYHDPMTDYWLPHWWPRWAE